MKKSWLTYEEFGAAGDGFHDDTDAIAACHATANAQALPVRARDGAVYYLGGKANTAEIRTDTDFGTARFIVDDRAPETLTAPIFHVGSDQPRFTPAITSLRAGQRRVEFPHEGRVFVQVTSDEKRVYIRKGLNQNNGSDLSECFTVDGDGNVETTIDNDFRHITSAWARCIDDRPITVRGGFFETIANQYESVYRYHHRGFSITRANVTVSGLTHTITCEGEHGAPYSGFLTVSATADVTIADCLLTPHYTYWTESQIPGQKVPMGSYDISCSAAIRLSLLRVHQTIDIMDSRYWGLMGSNFCKDFRMEDCVMSRFDAHCGVTNGVIRRCTLGHMCLNLIGHGDFLVEDTDAFGNALVNLREDYGCAFDGVLTIRNCCWRPQNGGGSVIYAYNTGDHDFGYVCAMPKRVVIDGLHILDGAGDGAPLYLLPDYDPDYAPGKPFAYVPAADVQVRGIETESGRPWSVCAKPDQYPELRVREL